uniref:3-hydroxyisobutyrate dehydrogenase n=1 Tax=Caenorhabditis japonica TaxID=281687 RepID=A0A8R1DXB5_CAEJA
MYDDLTGSDDQSEHTKQYRKIVQKNAFSPNSVREDVVESKNSLSHAQCSTCHTIVPHSQLFVCTNELCKFSVKKGNPLSSPQQFFKSEHVFCGKCSFKGFHAAHHRYMSDAQPLAIELASQEVGGLLLERFDKLRVLDAEDPLDYVIMKKLYTGHEMLPEIEVVSYLTSSSDIAEWHERHQKCKNLAQQIEDGRKQARDELMIMAKSQYEDFIQLKTAISYEINQKRKGDLEKMRIKMDKHLRKMCGSTSHGSKKERSAEKSHVSLDPSFQNPDVLKYVEEQARQLELLDFEVEYGGVFGVPENISEKKELKRSEKSPVRIQKDQNLESEKPADHQNSESRKTSQENQKLAEKSYTFGANQEEIKRQLETMTEVQPVRSKEYEWFLRNTGQLASGDNKPLGRYQNSGGNVNANFDKNKNMKTWKSYYESRNPPPPKNQTIKSQPQPQPEEELPEIQKTSSSEQRPLRKVPSSLRSSDLIDCEASDKENKQREDEECGSQEKSCTDELVKANFNILSRRFEIIRDTMDLEKALTDVSRLLHLRNVPLEVKKAVTVMFEEKTTFPLYWPCKLLTSDSTLQKMINTTRTNLRKRADDCKKGMPVAQIVLDGVLFSEDPSREKTWAPTGHVNVKFTTNDEAKNQNEDASKNGFVNVRITTQQENEENEERARKLLIRYGDKEGDGLTLPKLNYPQNSPSRTTDFEQKFDAAMKKTDSIKKRIETLDRAKIAKEGFDSLIDAATVSATVNSAPPMGTVTLLESNDDNTVVEDHGNIIVATSSESVTSSPVIFVEKIAVGQKNETIGRCRVSTTLRFSNILKMLGAQNATLTFMVGAGNDKTFSRAESLLSLMGKNIVNLGAVGNGQAAKICNNMLLGIQMIAVAETMNLGLSMGLDAKALAGIINTSSGRCWSSDTYNPVPGVIEGIPSGKEYAGGFGTQLMAKDLSLAQNASTNTQAPTPMGSLAHQLYRILARDPNYQTKDFGVVYQFLKKQNK